MESNPTIADWTRNTLPGESRVWIYQSSREFRPDEVQAITRDGDDFVRQWAAHGQALHAQLEVFYNRFIVIFLDEAKAMASGCSIDASVGFIRQVQEQLGIDLLDRMQIAYRQGDQVRTEAMPQFQQLLADGTLNEDTVVFNNLVTDKAAFLSGWEGPLKHSWHRQLLR